MKKLLSVLLVSLLAVTLFAACGTKDEPAAPVTSEPEVSAEPSATDTEPPDSEAYGTTLQDIKDKGELIMGLDDTFAPMGFRESDGTLVGFDIDLANAVGEQLGVKITFQPINWDSKELELSTGKIDCIWNGLSVTKERMETLSLTEPYLANFIVVMTNEGVTIASEEDLANFNIGIQAGSAALEAVQASPSYSAFADKVTEYPTYDEVIMDMQAGRLDCMVIDQVFGEYKNAQMGSPFATAEIGFGEDFYAVAFRKDDTELTQGINEAIQALRDNGTTKEISEKWFGKDIVLG